MATTPFSLTAEVEQQAQALLERGQYNLALGALTASVDALMKRPELIGRALFLPGYDQIVEDLGEAIGRETLAAPVDADPGGCTLIVASETYATGGHTRVIEDMARHCDRPAIVITDLFGRLNKANPGVDCLYQRAGGAPVSLLPGASLLDKVINLQRWVALLRPRHVFLLGHHQDPVPYAALASSRLRVPCSFIHHTDHHPALGATMQRFRHVDLTDHLARICGEALCHPSPVLPLHVADQGCKPHRGRSLHEASVVTSGGTHKFTREGALPYRDIVRVACQTLGGAYHHIGPLPEDWVAEVRAHLVTHGLDPQRFVYHGPVPSLWGSLLAIDADVYLTSAPSGGGRAAIEAQGCGYPMVCHRHEQASDRPVFVTDIFHALAPMWSRLEELPAALTLAVADGAQHAASARAYYAQHYSEAHFTRVLHGLMQPDAA